MDEFSEIRIEQCEAARDMRDASAFNDDVVSRAADAILFERAQLLLIGGEAPGEPL